MGHLAIVNSDTIRRITNGHPYISIGGTLNAYPLKTISDLFADALAVRDGDYIFTWMIDGGGTFGTGFDRYYIATGKVYFDSSDPDYPIKVGVKKGYSYACSVPEEKALDLFRSHLLWNAIGKKSLGRGRSLSHQTLDEDGELLSLLSQANQGANPTVILSSPVYSHLFTRITINNFGPVQNYVVPPFTALSSVLVNNIVWNSGNLFQYEKTLEAFLCENLDSIQVSFCNLLGYPNYRIKWLGNYLPYGVAGKNIDLVCEIECASSSIVVVIELKKGPCNYNGYKAIVDEQLNNYSQFIADAYRSYRGNRFLIEQVVLTHSPRRNLASSVVQYKNTKWIGYDIDPINKTVSFARLL